VEQTCKSVSAQGPVERLRKPEDGERQVWKLVRRVGLIVALKGKKPWEVPGSQPG